MALKDFKPLFLLPILCLLLARSGSLGHQLSRPERALADPSEIQDSVTSLRMLSLVETGLLDFWNSSWPSLIKKEQENSGYFHLESSERPYRVSPNCTEDILHLAFGLALRELWALKMVDASGKVSGIFLGNIHWIGSFKDCISIRSENPPNATRSIQGRYCLTSIGSDDNDQNLNIRLGLCIPQTCNSTDAKALINILMKGFSNATYATDAVCSDKNTVPLDSGAVAVIVILSILGVFIVLGTCLDVCHRWRSDEPKIVNPEADDYEDDEPLFTDAAPGASEVVVQSLGRDGVSTESISTAPVRPTAAPRRRRKGVVSRFLMAFAFLPNAKKIFSTERSQEHGQLQALHGIRFLSMTWIILGHTYLLVYKMSRNIIVYKEFAKSFAFEVVLSGSVSVDTFFLLSGTLVSYLLLKEMRDRDGPLRINWAKFFFHRFWRLTPLYMLILAIYTTLVKYFANGPYWDKTFNENCQANWWTNLLYINNIVHVYETCITYTWYLANDMQFFLLSPLFVVLLYKWSWSGYIAIFVFMLASWITTGVLTYVNHFPPSLNGLMQNSALQNVWYNQVYITPWCRICPYLIGILLGYLLYRTGCRLKLPIVAVVLLWCLAAVCNLSVVFGLWNVARGHYLSPQISALYASLHRTAWSLGVAWVILACATGNGGFVNDLLSLPATIPLSRLTYAVYLVHPLIASWSSQIPSYVNHLTMVFMFLGNTTFSYLAAFVVSAACESPMINLERTFLTDRKRHH